MLGRQECATCHFPVEATSAGLLPARASPSPARLLEWSVGPGPRGSAQTEPQGFERFRFEDSAHTVVRSRYLGRAGPGRESLPQSRRGFPSSSDLVLGPSADRGRLVHVTGAVTLTERQWGMDLDRARGIPSQQQLDGTGCSGPCLAELFLSDLQTSAPGLVSPRNGRGSACGGQTAGPWDCSGCDAEVP